MTLAAGTRFGAYEVLEPLGEGGMGEVYRAHDLELERDVAIKVLPESFANDAGRVARFEQEAKTLAALNHANIAQIYGLERSGAQTAIVMELVEGPTLADRLEQGPLSPDEALGIARQIASALEGAHEKGIIHRDLKPANVKVTPDGTVKVLDFGIAKALDTRAASGTAPPALTTPAMTEAGILLGTAAYMSPEQARGKPVDQRTDIWAFGVLLYEMLTGQPAFAGDDVTVTLARVLERDTNLDTLPRSVSPAVRHTIKLCLQKDVRRRIRHIGDVCLGLEGVLETETRAEPAGARAGPRRGVLVVAGIVLTAVAAALITFVVADRLRPSPEPARVARFQQSLPAGYVLRRNGRGTIAVAPNGAAIVYNTGSGLLLRRLDDPEAHVIAGTEADLDHPFFSPDSRDIAYWDPSDTLYRVAVDGGSAPVMIARGITNPYGASWSEDNTILLGQETGIVRLPADGGTPELLIEAQGGEILFAPRLLPNGDSVLFGVSSVDAPVDGRIVVQSLATGVRKVLIEGGNDARYVSTGHLVYARGDALLGIPFDLDTLTVTGNARPLVPNVKRANASQTGVAQYGIAADGTLAYLSGQLTAADNTVVWVYRDGHEESLGIPPGGYNYVRVSPDGSRLLLNDGFGTDGIWIWDFGGATLSSLTLGSIGTGSPIWTRDSARVVYSSGVNGAIASKAANNIGPSMELAKGLVNTIRVPYFLTPSGTELVLMSAENVETVDDLGLLGLDGDGTIEWLVREPARQIAAELSPDGRWMAYQSNESGRDEIYVRPFPNVDDRVQVSNAGGAMPLWSRDGRELFYLESSNVGTADRMMVVSVAANAETFSFSDRKALLDPWLYLGTYAAQERTYDVSGDGQRFVGIKNPGVSEDDSETVVVINWFEELKRLAPSD